MMGTLSAAGLGEIASHGMAGRREEGKSCVLGAVGSRAAHETRLMRSMCKKNQKKPNQTKKPHKNKTNKKQKLCIS